MNTQTTGCMFDPDKNTMFLLVNKDPLFRLIMKYFSSRAPIAACLSFLIFSLPSLISSVFENVLYNPALSTDLAHDIGYWSLYFVTIPFFSMYSIIYYRELPKIFYRLKENRVLINNNGELDVFYKKIGRSFNSKILLWFIFGATIVISAVCLLTFVFSKTGDWHRLEGATSITYTNILTIPGVFFANYLFIQFAIRLMLGCFFIIYFFNTFNIDLKILHPDKCGGMGSIGELSRKLNIMVFVMGIMVALHLYSNITLFGLSVFHPINILVLTGYVAAAFMVVFSPMIAAHKKMLKAKNDFIHILNNEFERINEILKNNLKESRDIEEENFRQLKRIKEYYDLSAEQPIWPFNIKVVYGFVGSISPVLFFVADKAYSMFFG